MGWLADRWRSRVQRISKFLQSLLNRYNFSVGFPVPNFHKQTMEWYSHITASIRLLFVLILNLFDTIHRTLNEQREREGERIAREKCRVLAVT